MSLIVPWTDPNGTPCCCIDCQPPTNPFFQSVFVEFEAAQEDLLTIYAGGTLVATCGFSYNVPTITNEFGATATSSGILRYKVELECQPQNCWHLEPTNNFPSRGLLINPIETTINASFTPPSPLPNTTTDWVFTSETINAAIQTTGFSDLSTISPFISSYTVTPSQNKILLGCRMELIATFIQAYRLGQTIATTSGVGGTYRVISTTNKDNSQQYNRTGEFKINGRTYNFPYNEYSSFSVPNSGRTHQSSPVLTVEFFASAP